MTASEPIDVPAESTQALAVRPQQALEHASAHLPQRTAQELRTVEVNEALLPAYQKASTLELTDAEIEFLQKPFEDHDVEVRPHDGLIYLPHILISDRLNKVFKPGKWALMCRRHWVEGTTMYGEYVLLVRGCYIGESIGGHQYQPNNPKTNYSDTLESTAAEALRRIAGKRLSCGSQVWSPEYARQWVAKYAEKKNDGKWYRRQAATPAPQQSHQPATKPQATTPKPAAASAPSSKPSKPAAVTDESTRTRLLDFIHAGPGGACRTIAKEYFEKIGWLLPTEDLEDLQLRYMPKSKKEAAALFSCIENFSAGGDAVTPYEIGAPLPSMRPKEPEAPPEQAADEPWRAYIMPFGKGKGTPLADLDKKYLYGLWANFAVETEYNGKPKKPETIAVDQEFREMLDAAGVHYQFEKKD